jgi:SprT protein
MNRITIDLCQQQRVIDTTLQQIRRAAELFDRPFEPIPVLFDLRGRGAGMYRVRGRERVIRYNPYLFAKYFDDNLKETVPHEVAHYVTDMLHGTCRVKPHGAEWRAVMTRFGARVEVTCRYDLEGIPVRVHRQHEYGCDCDTHRLGSRRHNRIARGEARYFCRRCRAELVAIAGLVVRASG